MEGGNGSRGSSWRSYILKIGSNVSSSSGNSAVLPTLHQCPDFPSPVQFLLKAKSTHIDRLSIDRERLVASADRSSCCSATMEGLNGGRGSSWWRYYFQSQKIGSKGSSSSGTIVSRASTAYTSSVSPFSMEAVAMPMHFDSLGIHEEEEEEEEHDGNNMDDWEEAEEEETGEERIRSLVQEFFSAQSANCSINRDDISVVERWVILSLEDASARKELDRDARSWTRALDQIAQTISLTRPLFPDGANLPASTCAEQGKHVGVRCVPDRYRLALVIQETMLKILTFVDILVAWDPNTTQELHLSMDWAMPPPYNMLISLLGAHGALSEASYKILTQIHRSTSVEIRRIEKEMDILLSAYTSKLGEAIRNTMEKTMTKLMEDGDDSSTSQESSDIHKVTRSVKTYIRFLWANYSSVDAAIRGQYVPHTENVQPLKNMATQMMSCLQEKLANISESFPDQGLKFLFLLNNSYFIQEFQHLFFVQQPMLHVDFNQKIEDHMQRYLQVSWAPLLSSLFNSTPLCLGKHYSPLSKFESEFQKIYTTQKHWKVPDPELRRRLREVITNKIIPGYKEYIEDNKVTNPKISPMELEVMLQELFEG